ncbi:LAMI_0E13872g1_1 [Lachancea mirantina]|uniref:Decapping nuclease n=1 Tax=Lachancea mirantina TaxID=1230905 RepID=A0A1G4JR53_9SACH|nr:LAMI_0E13872g1_1 [Lachancea mirantina]
MHPDELLDKFERLNVTKDPESLQNIYVDCKKFAHVKIQSFPTSPFQFFDKCEEVGTLTKWLKDGTWVLNSTDGWPLLRENVCKFMQDGDKRRIRSYIGHDMASGFASYVPLPPGELEDMTGAFEFIKQWEHKNGKRYPDDCGMAIVCARHHLISLAMAPFGDEDVNFIAVAGEGYLFLWPDKQYVKKDLGIRSPSATVRKICYAGFELENLLTRSATDLGESRFYSLVEGRLNENVRFLFKAEMDSCDSKGRYTEIKSSTSFRRNNLQHRRKLLRIWIQTSLIPETNILVGFRDPQCNQLTALKCYSRLEIYKKFNSNDLPVSRNHYNFNANISVQWFRHLMHHISKLESLRSKPSEGPKAFKFKLTKDCRLFLRQLPIVPQGMWPKELFS